MSDKGSVMEKIRTTCSACGAPLELVVAQPLSGAEVTAPLCPSCTDHQFLANGGSVVALQRDLPGTRFPLGKITVTPGAVAALSESAQHAVSFLLRHVRGDWGDLGQCDQIQLTDDEWRRGWE